MKTMSKRQFLQYGLLGLGGVAAQLHGSKLFANSMENNSSLEASPLWKWSKESPYYIQTPRGVRCQICPNECTLKLGETSQCRNRVNVNNKLYSIAYGNPCAIHIDPVEKKPFFHFMPSTRAYSIATAGCNLACLNCQNWDISQSSPRDTKNYDLMPTNVVEEAIKDSCKSIAYTYTEPTTFYEYVYDTAKIARQKGIKNIFKSSGYINEKPLRDLCKYLDAANIDLKSFSEDIYLRLNGGKLQPVLNTLKILKEEGVWFEVTFLVIPGWTDDLKMIGQMCQWYVKSGFQDHPLHISRFHPDYKLSNLTSTPVATLESARKIAINAGINYVYVGNVPGSNHEDTICPICKKLLIKRIGFSMVENNLVRSECKYCGQKIAGVWQ
jgi:pyruvate formate lyase activating enzyme